MKNYFNDKKINSLIKKKLDNEINAYGGFKYAYAILNKKDPNDMEIINNHEPWFELYLTGSYQLIDPVILKALDRVQDFPWDEKLMITSELKLSNIFKAGEDYNINTGHTFLLHDNKSNLAMLSIFGYTVDKINFREVISENKFNLQYLLISIHQMLLELYKEIDGKRREKNHVLTNRENQILYWASLGKTYQEIGMILSIGISTVKFHMRNIVNKLGVSNAKHAIKLAEELKIIRPLTSQDQ
ncbi:LuxR family transcriptional regulator, quorum-sensing system regulator ExpR [Izhakiella capsodis]|uniref:LuxR family transcriptional regulator, quorum-sensing system regulator ExpR n=1 Tax=Izhakiella capsodis TaxID=1367852 RepID=A0A1I4V8M8_9GAMM|nr:LuxR family transcriptional regulator [Izhakiella capsodis]SFM97524.1 LuxR family transcriptional regulator, quorum-sensing system regulator ExpR [Izhakiella capsodis]